MAVIFDRQGIKIDDVAKTVSLKTGLMSGEHTYNFSDVLSVSTNHYKTGPLSSLQWFWHYEIVFEVRDIKKPRHVFKGKASGVPDQIARMKMSLPAANWQAY